MSNRNNESSVPSPTFRTQEQPTTNSSLFGRRPATTVNKTIDEKTIASNPWAAKAAAANGIKIEEKLNFESDKQFPALGGTVATSASKKGAWGSSTVTAAALAADWAQKDAEEKAAAAAEKARQEEEAARLAEQRRQYTTFNPSRSDIFRREVYQDEDDDRYSYEDHTYEYNDQHQDEFAEERNDNTW